MVIQRFFCHRVCLAASLILMMSGTQSTTAETFSFSLNSLSESDVSGRRVIRGSIFLDQEEERLEPQTFEFEMNHGDRGDQQSLDIGIRNQEESILEAVFDIFGLKSRPNRGQLDANVSGDLNPTNSEVNVDLGEDMPGMRINVKTPQ